MARRKTFASVQLGTDNRPQLTRYDRAMISLHLFANAGLLILGGVAATGILIILGD